MPIFDLSCPKCNVIFEDVLINDADAPRLCLICGTPANSFGVIAHLHGIESSKPETSTQLGVTFSTSAEKKEYLRAHNLTEYDKGSSDERCLSDGIRHKAEVQAKRQGFSDLEDRNRRYKAEMNRGWRPEGNKR